MRAPAFWWQPQPTRLARLLEPLGRIWGGRAAQRLQLPGASASVPVICVGNPIAGGAGKTPAAIEIARLLIVAGRRPVFLTRGYKGRLRGPVRVDPAVHTASDVGDEPLLLARSAPCIVARDRPAGAELAAKFGDVVVMDDGFQNPSLRKDISFLVFDSGASIGNGLCIPAGPLRAPLTAQMDRADAILLIGDEPAARNLPLPPDLPVLQARLVPDTRSSGHLRGCRVLAYAGIGRPQKFAGTLKGLGAEVVLLKEYPDHHPYTAKDARDLLHNARRHGLTLVTTEKDRARLGSPELKELADASHAVPVRLAFDDPKLVTAGLMRLFAQVRP